MELYSRLELDKTATQVEIKTAYKRLVKVHHPDKGGDKEVFTKLLEAYEVLSDSERREVYDREGIVNKKYKNTADRFIKFSRNLVLDFICNGDPESRDLVDMLTGRVEISIDGVEEFLVKLREERKKLVSSSARSTVSEGEDLVKSIIEGRVDELDRVEKTAEGELKRFEGIRRDLDRYSWKYTQEKREETQTEVSVRKSFKYLNF